jgi:genome maintenance exonuclease 1|tara:strand:- start:681 stop:1427 length:747 start_codon:yes stop_codon:yes gene_type:complete
MATAESLAYTETINGKRYYIVGDNKFPSVTTILGAMTDSSGIDKWKKRIGEEKANAISRFSANRGTVMHQFCEYFLGSEKETVRERLIDAQTLIGPFVIDNGFTEEETNIGRKLFFNFYNGKCFDRIANVVSIEDTLVSPVMGGYAGRVDIIYKNKKGHLMILDFKSSKKPKKEDWIENYKMQIAAYSLAYWKMTGIKPTGGEIWISNEADGFPQIFEMTFNDIAHYGKKFLGLVKEFHNKYPLKVNI